VLALDALAREAARLPLVVGVLEELAVQREAVRRELVATLAELGAEERGGARHAVVRERLPRRRRSERAVAARRAESLVATHVAAGADQSPGAQRCVMNRSRTGPLAVGQARRLLRQRRMAREAAQRRRGI